MSSGYPRSPKLLKGALVQFSAPLVIPIPNIIVFQYNPETLSRAFTVYDPPQPGHTPPPATPAAGDGQATADPGTAQPYDPQETFTVALQLDASDALETPDTHPVAALTGVADRLAALEMLLYPAGDSLLGNLLGTVSASVSIGSSGISLGGGAAAQPTPRREVPILLFIYGPGKIQPVRLTSFAIEEQAANPLLYPIRAKVSLGMRVLTKEAIAASNQSTVVKDLAIFAHDFTRGQKELLALSNLANSVESIAGMLPF